MIAPCFSSSSSRPIITVPSNILTPCYSKKMPTTKNRPFWQRCRYRVFDVASLSEPPRIRGFKLHGPATKRPISLLHRKFSGSCLLRAIDKERRTHLWLSTIQSITLLKKLNPFLVIHKLKNIMIAITRDYYVRDAAMERTRLLWINEKKKTQVGGFF